MTRLDRVALTRRGQAIEQLLGEIAEASRGMSPALLRRDRRRGKDLCYTMIQTIQLALDMAEMVIAHQAWAPAETYAAIPTELSQHGLIRRTLAGRMAEAAKFRNVLVHRYADLDYALVLRHARSLPATVRAFVRALARRA